MTDKKDNSKTKIEDEFFNVDNKTQEKKLFNYFSNKKIYLDIYNGEKNINDIYLNLIRNYNINIYKNLNKNIDYIVFKEGHLKTKKYAYLNNIKIVSPLWIFDKVNENKFKDDKEYIIDVNYNDILIKEKLKEIEKEDKRNTNNKEKNFDVDVEVEFDSEYANLVDKIRDNNGKNKDNNKEKQKININNKNNNFKILREKRSSNLKKTKNDINKEKNKNKELIF